MWVQLIFKRKILAENSGYNACYSRSALGSCEMVSDTVSELIRAGEKHGCWGENALLSFGGLEVEVPGSLKSSSTRDQPVCKSEKQM